VKNHNLLCYFLKSIIIQNINWYAEGKFIVSYNTISKHYSPLRQTMKFQCNQKVFQRSVACEKKILFSAWIQKVSTKNWSLKRQSLQELEHIAPNNSYWQLLLAASEKENAGHVVSTRYLNIHFFNLSRVVNARYKRESPDIQ
jgi:hypothetical protein